MAAETEVDQIQLLQIDLRCQIEFISPPLDELQCLCIDVDEMGVYRRISLV